MQTARIVKLEKFYVHKSDYGQFRRNILQKLDKYCSEYTDIPVVGPKMPNVSNWIMIEVISKDCEVVLPICADTLYLVGWKKGKLHEGFPWFIAAGEMKRVVLKGKKEELPFTGNYRAVGDPHSAFIDRETLDWAVSTLCSYKNSSGPGALDAFRIMILMFCAGVRIIPIYRAIYQATRHGVVGHCISVEDTSRERNWKAVSEVYLSGKEGKEVSGYGIVSYDCMKTNLSVLLYYSRGEHKLTKGRGWQSVTPPRRRDRGKRTKKGDSGADTSSHRGSGSVQESSGSGSVNFKGKANNFGGRKSIMTPDVEDNKIIVPRNSLVEVNRSGLLMETIIDITPWDPLPTPSAGPLDPNCAKEGLTLCDRDRIKGQTGVSLDALVGIFTWLGREMEGNGVSNSYKLAEKVASIMQVAQPLLEKKLKAIAEDEKPLLSEVQDSALIKDVEIITKSLAEGTKDFRRLQSSVLIPENSDLVGQSVYSLIFTLKNIESRCVNMIAHCFSATMGVGTVKSSKAMLAGLTFKMLAGQNKRKAEGKPCDKPKIVTGANVQFARYFEVKLKEVKLKEGYYIMDLEKAVEMVEDNTICVASVLGSTLAGEFEDVNKLNELLTQKNKEIGVDISRSLAERLADIQKVVEEFSEQVKQVPKTVTAQVSITARSGGADGALVHKREQEIAEEMVT